MKRRKFPVIQGQVEVEYVDIIHHSRRAVVFEIGTRQKYSQVIAYDEHELHLLASERTREDSYDAAAPASTVMFPRPFKGWEVLPQLQGRYSLRVALYKPGKRSRNLMKERSTEWRIRKLTRTGE